ncbi:hypothetical protein H2O64_08250 [Kordia sp. YSTF-M3]|uniref:Uncharacterized protein n=1 Tax=Kordia aestuariivivens TaxID=2759037 RepID=A0ABR7Q846_9FLAO|nr:hypothetical protein [Kordia aestuariivivens]MBC8754663.1 hypothetical protein [Kordia aestuariivivens]
MSTNYSIEFGNETNDTWTLCIYQKFPESPGLESVSWKQTRVPKGGNSALQWNINYSACLVNYKQNNSKGVYSASQKLYTDLGKKWSCVFKEGVQQLESDGTAELGHLVIENKSLKRADLGIGVDGDLALVQKNVYSANSAQFIAKPKYYAALFRNLTKGEVISGNEIHPPIEVVFDGGQTEKKFIAKVEGSKFIFEEVGTNTRFEAPYDEIKEVLNS